MPGRPTCMTLKLPEDLKSFIDEKQTETKDDTIEDKMEEDEEEDEEEINSEEEEIKSEAKPAKKQKSNPVTKKKIKNTKNGLHL